MERRFFMVLENDTWQRCREGCGKAVRQGSDRCWECHRRPGSVEDGVWRGQLLLWCQLVGSQLKSH